MAAYQGCLVTEVLLYDTGIMGDAAKSGLPENTVLEPIDFNQSCGLQNYINDPGESIAWQGCISQTFFTDFYGRIHIRPSLVGLGTVLQGTIVPIEVWSSYLQTNYLVEILATNQDTLEISGNLPPPNVAFEPLESRIYELSISLDGNPAINTFFDFNFTVGSGRLTVTGQRVQPFPYPYNWSEPVVERLEWKTEILISSNRFEQRIKLREGPRRSYLASYAGFYEQRAILDAILNLSIGVGCGIPLWTDQTNLTQKGEISSTRIYLDTVYRQFEVGGYLLLYADNTRSSVYEILDLSDTWIELSQPLTSVWPRSTVVTPLVVAYPRNNTEVSRPTGSIVTGEIEFTQLFQLTEGSSIPAMPQFSGYYVLNKMPNWKDGRTLSALHELSVIDNEVNNPRIVDPSELGNTVRSFDWFLNGRTAIEQFRRWLTMASGRFGAFWMPTWEPDLLLAEDYTINSVNIKFVGHLVSTFYRCSCNPVRVMIQTRTGQSYFTKLVIAEPDNVNPDNDLVAISPAIGANIPVSKVLMISLMFLSRNESDSVELRWHTPSLATCQQRIYTLPRQPS